MNRTISRFLMAAVVSTASLAPLAVAAAPAGEPTRWEHAGWGGGGFYFGAAFHPSRDGVMYLGGNVNGLYRSEDHGRNWTFSSKGLRHYIVHSLAVDPVNTDTVYASTQDGLHKSTDAGLTWRFIEGTEKAQLRITGERDTSIQPIVVDPTNGDIVYAGGPGGVVYKSVDGALTWRAVHSPEFADGPADAARVEFGRNGGATFGGVWWPVDFPASLPSPDAAGIALALRAESDPPERISVMLVTSAGHKYRGKEINARLAVGEWRDVILRPDDFALADSFLRENPELARTAPATPDWAAVNRVELVAGGALANRSHVLHLRALSFVARRGGAETLVPALAFAPDAKLQTYGNARVGAPVAGAVYSVDVARSAPSRVAAATADRGVLLSEDAGATWRALPTPANATSVVFDPADASVLYGSFGADGVWKSTDAGRGWTNVSGEFGDKFAVRQVVVNPADSNQVYCIGASGWNGAFFRSADAGRTWTRHASMTVAPTNPTITSSQGLVNEIPMSKLTNLAVNPLNPKQLFISSNWRPCLSEDGGLTWTERDNGADITVHTDIRFSGDRVYVSAMDEGTLASDDQGKSWRQLWPSRYTNELTGHSWRLAVTKIDGKDRVIGTQTPWNNRYPNRVVLSADGGESYSVATSGLPDHMPRRNTMWGQGYARALAVDPNNPQIVWLGIDGDAEPGKSGGGVFKSEDGGRNWTQLPNQPGSRRMFNGLVVDPTDSRRVFWGACGTDGGVWRTTDSGRTWENVFSRERFVFNLHITREGHLYAGGANLWRSTDHGKTWSRLARLPPGFSVVGLETHPDNPAVIWYSAVKWGGVAEGGVHKSEDGGATWREITGDLPYVKPLVLRYNPRTRELWAGSVGLFKTPQ